MFDRRNTERCLEDQGRALRPVVREAYFQDYEGIKELHARNGLPTMSRESWTALWTANPVYQRLRSAWPIGWVLESGLHGLVGYIGSIPGAYRFRGREVLAAMTRTWITDPRYRGYSLTVLNALMKGGGAELYLTNTANAVSAATLQLLGWSRVPAGAWDRSHFWVTSHYSFSRWFLADRNIPLPGIAAVPLALALGIRSGWKVRRSPIPALARAVDFCADFDARFDAFWEELEALNPGVLLALRSREALEWHFGPASRQGQLRILTRGGNSRITAYAIFDRHHVRGLMRFRLVDFQALEDAPGALALFLSRMLYEVRETGAHILESAGYPLQCLGKPDCVAPYRRTLKSWMYYYKATSTELREALASPDAWRPSYYDGDASL